MEYRTIRYNVAENVATVTLDRPDKLNAYNRQMHLDLLDVFDRIDEDDEVRVAIITGSGRAFCAGADLEGGASSLDFSDVEDSPVRSDGTLDYSKQSARDPGGVLSLRMFRCLKPLIAAINGAAVGVGVTMTLPMDIRIASENARFGFVFARRGIVPEAASSYFLPRVAGIEQALRWCFSGRVFPAAEALQGGLVSEVLPADAVLDRANEIAREIAENTAPVSVALIRQMLWQGLGMSHPMQAHQVDSRGILALGRGADVAEGINSFLEKRPARFPMRVSQDMPDYFPWSEEPRYG